MLQLAVGRDRAPDLGIRRIDTTPHPRIPFAPNAAVDSKI